MRTSHEMDKRASGCFVPGFGHRGNLNARTPKSDRILEVLKMQGKSKGWMFLIEIPGNLFTKAHLRAGVFCRHNNPERLLYVLFDGTGSEVVLFNDDEAPDSANKLALSYANVIRQLNDTAGAFSLH